MSLTGPAGSADAPLASDNVNPAAPNTGRVLLRRFRFEASFSDMGESSRARLNQSIRSSRHEENLGVYRNRPVLSENSEKLGFKHLEWLRSVWVSGLPSLGISTSDSFVSVTCSLRPSRGPGEPVGQLSVDCSSSSYEEQARRTSTERGSRMI